MADYCFKARENEHFFFAIIHYKPEVKKVLRRENGVKTKLPQISRRLISVLAKYGIEYQEKPQKGFVVSKENLKGLDMLKFLVFAGFDWEGQF